MFSMRTNFRRLALIASIAAFCGIFSAAKVVPKSQIVPALISAISGDVTAIIVLAAILASTVLFGRLYCAYICPFGLLQDLFCALFRFCRRLFPAILRRRTARVVRRIRWIVLGAVICCAACGFNLISIFDPYANFGRLITASSRLAILSAFFLCASFISPRFYCAFICPVGAGLSLISKLRLKSPRLDAASRRTFLRSLCVLAIIGAIAPVLRRGKSPRAKIDFSKCRVFQNGDACGRCAEVCPCEAIGTYPSGAPKMPNAARCVACGVCVKVCPERAIKISAAD